jgi:hypothetical protein
LTAVKLQEEFIEWLNTYLLVFKPQKYDVIRPLTFTLTYLSQLYWNVFSQRTLKAKMTERNIASVSGGTRHWSAVEIRGTTNARTMTSEFIFFTREKSCQFAGDAGAK